MSAGDDSAARGRRRERTDARTQATSVIGYEDQAGEVQALTGDEDGPQVAILVRSSSDGVTGLVAEANGVNNRLAADSLGRLWVAPGGVSANRYSSAVAEKQATIATVPTRVFRLQMIALAGTGADTWLMVFDSNVPVVNGATPIWRSTLPNPGAGAGECFDVFDEATFATATGLVVAMSTTSTTLTLPAGNQALFEILSAPV